MNDPVSIFDFVEHWKNEGYGIALVEKTTQIVVAPYVDPSDYPDLMFRSLNNGTSSVCGKYTLVFHSGCLEDKNYFVELEKKH